MLRTGGNNNATAIFHHMPGRIDNDNPLSFFETKELVNGVMYLHTDIFLRLQAHEYELAEFPRIQYPAEIRVLPRLLFEICCKFAAKPFFMNFTSWLF